MSEDIDDFSILFSKGTPRAERLKVRAERERRSQMTDAQRKRGATRTAQINFRCSPQFVADVKATAEAMSRETGQKISIADVLEDALAMLRQHRVRGQQ